MHPLKSDETTERAVFVFLRQSLSQRYSLDNIRRYAGFDGLPNDRIEALRDFGLNYIYPEWAARQFQNRAFEKMTALLANPMRMSRLTAVALKSLFRFGRDLPKAVDAGKQVVGAFEATRRLENLLTSEISGQRLESLEPAWVEQAAAAALAKIGRSEFQLYVNNMVSLMHLLTQRSLLTTGASVLQDVAQSMDRLPDVYDETERGGARYAVEIMMKGTALFDTLDQRAVLNAIAAIPEVEHAWFDAVTRGKSVHH